MSWHSSLQVKTKLSTNISLLMSELHVSNVDLTFLQCVMDELNRLCFYLST